MQPYERFDAWKESHKLVLAVYHEIDASLHPLACRSLIAGLEKLAEDGIARADGNRWRAL